MSDTDLNQSFAVNGFVVVRGVLSPEEVIALRGLLEEQFSQTVVNPNEGPRRVMLPREILKVPELYLIPFKEKIIAALRQILEVNYTVFPDLMIQRNMFGCGPGKGWHVDSGSEGRNSYLLRPDYRFVKCGVFLQGNSREWGGGIDVLPGGHRFPLVTGNNDLNFRLKVLSNRVRQRFFGKMIDIKAGDFVAFDSRLPHISTWPNRLAGADVSNAQIKNVPSDKTKFAIYWNACRKNSALDFLKNSELRAEKEEIQGGHPELFFADYLRLKFPESYPADFVSAAKNAGLEVASLDEASARSWDLKYQAAKAPARSA